MSETRELRVTFEADEEWRLNKTVEGIIHELNKKADDLEVNHGVSMTVERIETEDMEDMEGFE